MIRYRGGGLCIWSCSSSTHALRKVRSGGLRWQIIIVFSALEYVEGSIDLEAVRSCIEKPQYNPKKYS